MSLVRSNTGGLSLLPVTTTTRSARGERDFAPDSLPINQVTYYHRCPASPSPPFSVELFLHPYRLPIVSPTDRFSLRVQCSRFSSQPPASSIYRKEVSAPASPRPGSATRSPVSSPVPTHVTNWNPPPTLYFIQIPTLLQAEQGEQRAHTDRKARPSSWFLPHVQRSLPVQRKLDEPPSAWSHAHTSHPTKPNPPAPHRTVPHYTPPQSIHSSTGKDSLAICARALLLFFSFLAAPLPSPPSKSKHHGPAARSISEPGPYWIATSVRKSRGPRHYRITPLLPPLTITTTTTTSTSSPASIHLSPTVRCPPFDAWGIPLSSSVLLGYCHPSASSVFFPPSLPFRLLSSKKVSMSDDEFGGPDGPPGSAGGDRDKRAPRFSWTPAYEATFFRSLCDSVQLGLRENHSFKADAWDRAATALREKHGAYPTKSHLVNKSDNARKKFRLWRGLREDPEFLYNPTTRTVTASEEAWKAHIEKEPLSRALRGRPFDHEQFMEILYPDVVGSGGAPKRIMKPKRKGPDVIQGSEDPDMPGTAVLDLQVEPPYGTPSQTGINHQVQPRGSVSQSPVAQVQQPMIPQQQQPQQQQQQQQQQQIQQHQQPQQQQQRPTSTAIPPRTHIAGTSALTPPEETATGRKRFPQQVSTSDTGGKAPTAPMGPPAQPAEKRRRTSGYTNPAQASAAGASNSHSHSHNHSNDATTASMVSAGKQLMEDGLIKIADALRGRSPPRWPEQAIDIFFRDFSDEDMDLQLKIAEKALADDNKAMIFCKMSPALRKHWVKRLRELHNNSRNT